MKATYYNPLASPTNLSQQEAADFAISIESNFSPFWGQHFVKFDREKMAAVLFCDEDEVSVMASGPTYAVFALNDAYENSEKKNRIARVAIEQVTGKKFTMIRGPIVIVEL